MKFLLDVCVSSRSLESFLSEDGHDVVSVYSIDPRATDERLLELAFNDGRVLVTADKDFGELVFVRHLNHGPIVRLAELSVEDQGRAIVELLDQFASELTGSVVLTVTLGRVRIRRV